MLEATFLQLTMLKMEQSLHALSDMALFVEVARAGSFRQAAARLVLPPSTLSRRIAAMEKRLGVRLLLRTTRNVRLTAAAEPYYAQCLQVLEAAERAQASLVAYGQHAGKLRITMPVDLGVDVLGGMMASFAAGYPGLRLEMLLDTRTVDLLREPIDLAFRIGKPLDERVVARKPADIRSGLYASPAFVARYGPIVQPSQLPTLPCLNLLTTAGSMPWHIGELGWPGAPGASTLSANSVALLCKLCESGHGIALLPQHIANQRVALHHLQRILPDVTIPVWPLFVVSVGRQLSPLAQALLDHVRSSLRSDYLAPPDHAPQALPGLPGTQ